MLQTFCYLCIKKPLTLPHTPLRLLKHRTKNTYEPPKERTTKRTTRRTNHEKNDQKARTQRTNHEKNDQKHEPKERTTKRTTKRTNPEERTTKSTTEKHEPKSTNPAPMFQARLTAPVFASPPLKATKHSKRP